jgi:cell division control protein 45
MRVSNRPAEERLIWRDEVRRLNPPPLHRDPTQQGVSDTSVREVEDFPFTLLRHWSLYNAMLHSPYLCTKLRLYTAKGRSRLDNILAKMGISRENAKQAWTHTPRELKKSLPEKLEKAESGFGLELVQGKTFERGWGYKGTWSAGDVVQVIEATLVSVEEGSGKENITPPGEGKDDNPADRFRQREGEMKTEWVTRFWRALDAIDKSIPILR